MAKTPFIRPLQVQGGTFYTFTSSAEDLSFTFNNSVNKFRFSKFALLNIPDIDNSSNSGTNYKITNFARNEKLLVNSPVYINLVCMW